MIVRLFKPQFAPLVEAGTKLQTVRPLPKRMPKAGQLISLRAWSGKPYRSKQRHLRTSTISKVEAIYMASWNLELGSGASHRSYTHPRNTEKMDEFARVDGFADFGEMFEWFEQEHGLPFTGIVIHWT